MFSDSNLDYKPSNRDLNHHDNQGLSGIQTDLACDEKAISVVLYKVLLDVWDAQDTSIFWMHYVGLSSEEARERWKKQ